MENAKPASRRQDFAGNFPPVRAVREKLVDASPGSPIACAPAKKPTTFSTKACVGSTL
jgi:hypothetical protein